MSKSDGRKAILYAAKSTEDVRGSIGTQLADGRAMAESEGYEVVAEYAEESVSAFRGNRGGKLRKAKEHAAQLASEGCDVALFVQHSDRIARGDGVVALQVIDHVRDSWRDHYGLRSVQDDFALTEPTGLMAYVMGVRNFEDSRRKGLAISAGVKRMAERGRHHGPAPYGYRWQGKGDEKLLVIHDAEADVVRRCFSEYADGLGFWPIARRLTADGVKPPRSDAWNRHTVGNILRCAVYVGKVVSKGVEYDGEHEAIVDDETYRRALAQRATRQATSGDGRPPNGGHVMTGGLLRCGVCGSYMRTRTHRPPRQPRYECSNRAGGCSMQGVIASEVDRPLLEYLSQVVFDLEATREDVAAELDRQAAQTNALLADAEGTVSDLDAQLQRIQADYRRGAITADEWHDFRDEITDERDAAQAELDQLRTRAAEVTGEREGLDDEREALERLAEVRRAAAGAVTSADGLDELRAAIRNVFSRIELWRDESGRAWLVPHLQQDSVFDPYDVPDVLVAEPIASGEDERDFVADLDHGPMVEPRKLPAPKLGGREPRTEEVLRTRFSTVFARIPIELPRS